MIKLALRWVLLLFSLLPVVVYPLTLRDKIGQMIMLGFDGTQVNASSEIVKTINQYNLGGVILFDYDSVKESYGKNIRSLKQISALTKQLQLYTKQAERRYHRPLLPLLIAIDYEGGEVDRFRTAEGFEPTLPAALLPKLVPLKVNHEIDKITQNLKATGFNLNFAPVLDVNVNPDNPVIGVQNRSFSSDPRLVTNYARQFTHALLTHDILCAYKHFPGHGSATKDSHMDFVDVSQTWKSYELFPYQKLFSEKEACPIVMTAHIVNRQLDPSGLPATLSHTMLTNLLRKYLHFKGVVISDDLQMDAIQKHYPLDKSIPLAINAGVDILLFANQTKSVLVDPAAIINLIESKVKSGEIPVKRIDEAYARIVALKSHLPS